MRDRGRGQVLYLGLAIVFAAGFYVTYCYSERERRRALEYSEIKRLLMKIGESESGAKGNVSYVLRDFSSDLLREIGYIGGDGVSFRERIEKFCGGKGAKRSAIDVSDRLEFTEYLASLGRENLSREKEKLSKTLSLFEKREMAVRGESEKKRKCAWVLYATCISLLLVVFL